MIIFDSLDIKISRFLRKKKDACPSQSTGDCSSNMANVYNSIYSINSEVLVTWIVGEVKGNILEEVMREAAQKARRVL